MAGAVPFGRGHLRKCYGLFLASRRGLFVVNHDLGVQRIPHHPSCFIYTEEAI